MKSKREKKSVAYPPTTFVTRSNRRWFRILAPILAPLLFIGTLECALRLGGYGYPTSFYLKKVVAGREVLVNNPTFSWRFFGPALGRSQYPVTFPIEKPPGTIRVFVFGESAAYGDPDPDFGLPRMLRVLLEDHFPGTRFEVINAAMVAINSNVILPIARECARQHGDIWVIYMGNNEVVGPYGSGTVFGSQAASRATIRASLAVKSTRTGQLLGTLLQHLGAGQTLPTEWKGMMLFAQNKVRQSDPRMALVYSHFKDNLADILETGRNHQVKMVVSTVASNLRDCAPFASLHRTGLSEAQLAEWDKAYQAGIAAEQAGKSAEALALYQQCAQVDDQFADLQFREARCALTLGRQDAARARFIEARDYDALRFRADSRINDIIRQTARNREKEGILLFDAEKAFTESSPDNLPGRALLYEHVHLTFAGNYLLARGIVEQVARLVPPNVQSRDSGAWMSKEDCAQRMVWTGWNQRRALQNLPIRFPPFTAQLDHNDQYHRVEQELQNLSSALEPAALRRTADAYRLALAHSPDDWAMHQNLAQILERLGDFSGAALAWQEVIRLLPFYGEAHLRLGLLAMQQGNMAEALSQFETELELDPHAGQAPFVKLLNETASQFLERGKVEDAIRLYQQALEFKDDSTVHINLGVAQIVADRTNEAHESFNAALESGAIAPQSLILLGESALAQGWTNEAITGFQRVVDLDPADAAARCRLGDAFAAAGRFTDAKRSYVESVRLKADYAEAHARLGIELSREGRGEEATKEFAEALRLNPNLSEAHLNWGMLLFKQQKMDQAISHFEEVLRISPADATARKYLNLIRAKDSGGA